jgi:hypothetical protein
MSQPERKQLILFFKVSIKHNKDFRESCLVSFSQIIIVEIVQTVEIIKSQLYNLQKVFE